jgi:hypothetical protein
MDRVTLGDLIGWGALMLAGAGYIAFIGFVLLSFHH